jgi:hypothetical protein
VLREMYSDVYFEGSGTAWSKRKCTCNGTVFTSLGIRLCMSSTNTGLRECDPERGTANGDARNDFSEGKINQQSANVAPNRLPNYRQYSYPT